MLQTEEGAESKAWGGGGVGWGGLLVATAEGWWIGAASAGPLPCFDSGSEPGSARPGFIATGLTAGL